MILSSHEKQLPIINPAPQPAPISTYLEQEVTEIVSESTEEVEPEAAEVIDYSKMKTIVLIPTERAPEDPSWLLKRHANRKLSSEESLQYYEHLYL